MEYPATLLCVSVKNMDTVDIFRENLRRITDAKKPRQSKIADDCGIARSEMNDFLQGRKRFGMDRLEKIANYLNIPIAKMISPVGSDEADPGEASNVVPLINDDILKAFIDKDLARKVGFALLNIERLDRDVYEKLAAHIQSVEWGLRIVAGKCSGSGDRRKKNEPDKIPDGIDRRGGDRTAGGL